MPRNHCKNKVLDMTAGTEMQILNANEGLAERYESPIRRNNMMTKAVKVAYVIELLENGGKQPAAWRKLQDKGLLKKGAYIQNCYKAQQEDPAFGADVESIIQGDDRVAKEILRMDNAKMLTNAVGLINGDPDAKPLPEGVSFQDVTFISRAIREFTDPQKRGGTNVNVNTDRRELHLHADNADLPAIKFIFAGADEKQAVHDRRNERKKLLEIDGTATERNREDAAAVGGAALDE